MPKRLTLQPHLSMEELEQRYRQTKDSVERSHYQILWLLAKGKTTREVSEVIRYSLHWIRVIARRYNSDGVEAIADPRHDNRGATPMLSEVQQMQLLQVLSGPAPDGGLWTGTKVAKWIAELIDRPVAALA